MTTWRVDTWTNVKPGSIDHALDKLESQGMIETAASGAGAKLGPSRKEYSVTKQGKAEFFRLLEAALVSPDILQFSAGVAFMEWLPRNEVIALLEQRRTVLEPSHFRTDHGRQADGCRRLYGAERVYAASPLCAAIFCMHPESRRR